MFLHLSVSHSIHGRGGGYLPHTHWADTPWADNPPADTQRQTNPPGQTPPIRHTPLGRHPPSRHPLGRHPLGRHPPDQCMLGFTPLANACWGTPPCPVHAEIHTHPAQCMLGYTLSCWDTVNKRAVRILLECILVL